MAEWLILHGAKTNISAVYNRCDGDVLTPLKLAAGNTYLTNLLIRYGANEGETQFIDSDNIGQEMQTTSDGQWGMLSF